MAINLLFMKKLGFLIFNKLRFVLQLVEISLVYKNLFNILNRLKAEKELP